MERNFRFETCVPVPKSQDQVTQKAVFAFQVTLAVLNGAIRVCKQRQHGSLRREDGIFRAGGAPVAGDGRG
jgi:hypothetical protein